jgi:protein-disulfide isomerase
VNKKVLFGLAVAVVVIGFVLAAREMRERRSAQVAAVAQEQASPLVRPHSPVLGPEAAKVTIVEFTDPACETCAAFAPFLKAFMGRYPGRVRLVLRYAPFHPGAEDAVRVLEAARAQGKLWETLDLLYRHQGAWTVNHQVRADRILELVPQVPLDMARLRADMADPRIAALIEQDLADASALGVRATPGIFVNGKPLEPFGLEPLGALVAAEVRASYPD